MIGIHIAIVVLQLKRENALADLVDLFIARGSPAHIKSVNSSDFIATAVLKWLAQIGVITISSVRTAVRAIARWPRKPSHPVPPPAPPRSTFDWAKRF